MLTPEQIQNRIILLLGSRTYRANPFVDAAERLGLEIVKGINLPKELAEYYKPTLPLQFADPMRAADDVIAYAKQNPVRTILAVDDDASVIAARACEELDISHNSPDAAYAAKNKFAMRERLREQNVPSPRYRLFSIDDDPRAFAPSLDYPCVVKPTMLSASQGVIRANDPGELIAAFKRTRAIIRKTGSDPNILIEDYIPGIEVALEGILSGGRLHPLALFDKPDPLIGPFFEETIYVTPSRLARATQDAIFDGAMRACAAIGLREGPIHAELRVNDAGVWIVEVAGRSIGGLCAKILRFGTEEISLEELIIRQAMGLDVQSLARENRAGGVMMIPIPSAGLLNGVAGIEAAKAIFVLLFFRRASSLALRSLSFRRPALRHFHLVLK
ncbi:MAG: ATP-grasp domain-containing protein [Chloroflexi bacterium]|nr:ATP-grasp domain-containing protein [Chloroflexota bacterium]